MNSFLAVGQKEGKGPRGQTSLTIMAAATRRGGGGAETAMHRKWT